MEVRYLINWRFALLVNFFHPITSLWLLLLIRWYSCCLQIKVRLPSGKLVIGTLWKYDSYYNIAVVNIKASPELREACIHNQVPANVKLSQSKLVAIGRAFESGELMATGGTLLHGTTKFDCQQLMASTCKITKVFPLSSFMTVDRLIEGKVIRLD